MEESNLHKDVITRKVVLTGTTDIMFDRYSGDNKTVLEPWQRLYLQPGGRQICLPALNIISFMSAENTDSAPKLLMDSRTYKKFCQGFLSYTSISPQWIPFKRNGNPILLGQKLDEVDPESGVYIHRTVARLAKGIPNPKVRPVLPAPWSLEFELKMFPNSAIQEQQIKNIMSQGGRALGLGTFRKVFGKFEVTSWDSPEDSPPKAATGLFD